MLCVKITVFLIVITIICRFIVNNLLEQESLDTKLNIAMDNKYPPYLFVFGLLIIIDAIGIICSAFWFLFLR